MPHSRWLSLSSLLILVLIASCNLPVPQDAAPDKDQVSPGATLPVTASPSTTSRTPLPSLEPAPPSGSVTGRICYPSEPPLPPLALYFEELDTGVLHSLEHTNGTGTYAAELPPGNYFAYAWREGFELGGSFSPAVPCGLNVNCTDHSLLPFQVIAGQTVVDIDICDWYGAPGDVPMPPIQPLGLTPAGTPTATPPPDGVSLNCDGTYQRLQIIDQGASGKTISVDAWDGKAWVNAWNMASGDPNVKQLIEGAGWYEFLGCQKLVIVPFRHSNPQVFLELRVHVWNGANLMQVYYNEGYYGEWKKLDDRIQFLEASKLGTVNNGPLGPCEWVTLEHTWNGVDFIQTGSAVNAIAGCTITIP